MSQPSSPSAAQQALAGTDELRPERESRFPEERTGVNKVGSREASTQGESLVGQILSGRFVIEKELAHGAMGSVHLGRHQRLARRVAIKVMTPHMSGDQRIVERFEREAEVMSALHHPNIVEILDYNRMEDGSPYLVMEYVEGPTLEQYLEDEGPLDVRTALSLSRQIGEALVAAHQLEIVHRDLKPANVVVQGTTEGPFVKLLDFGIAKRAAKDAALRRGAGRALTGEFEVMGTPAYMAPEQAAGKASEIDARGDQYSLAVLMFEMLTGEPPFDSEDVMDLLSRIINDAPTPPSRLVSGISSNVDRVVLRALSKRPEDRFSSVREMLLALSESAARHSLPPSLSQAALVEGAADKHEAPTLPPDGTPALRHNSSLPPEFFESNRRAARTRSNSAFAGTRETEQAHSRQATSRQAHSRQGSSPQAISPQAISPQAISPQSAQVVGSSASPSPGSTSPDAEGRSESQFMSRATAEPTWRHRERARTTAKDVRKLARERSPRPNYADVLADLDKARGECLLGNATLALCYLRSAVAQASTALQGEALREASRGEGQREERAPSEEAQQEQERASWSRTLSEAVELLKKVVELRIGSPQQRVQSTVKVSDLGSLSGLSREEVYVLTRVEGSTTLEELVDLSPLSEAETWASIAQLTSSGLLVPA